MTKSENLELMIDSLNLPNFRGRELTPYWSRTRGGVKNSIPPEALWMNIIPTLVVLQEFRTQYGSPISLIGTYRSPEYNRAVGGAGGSLHMQFLVIDFQCEEGTAMEWARLLRSFRGQRFQISGMHGKFTFTGGIGTYRADNFVHIDCRTKNQNWDER